MPAQIVPRWEWRTFGAGLRRGRSGVRRRRARRGERRDSTCSRWRPMPSVKVRDDVLDVKGLLAIDDDGLEQWVPVAKCALPGPARRRRRRARPAACGRATARPRGLYRRGPPRRGRAADRCAARRRGAQAAHPLHGRRLHGRDQRDPNRPGLDVLGRCRVPGSRARAGGPCARSASPRARTCAWLAG